MAFVFGKGMALCIRADIFLSGKNIPHHVCFFGKGMALSLRADIFYPV